MRSSKETILYVDDEQYNLDGFEVSFRRYYNILTTTSVSEAFSLIEANNVKVVISDQRMPEMSGLEFFAELKFKHPAIICIILTAYADVSAIMQAINQGGIYRFMLKPWNENEMKITIENAVETYNLKTENVQLAGELRGTNEKLAESELRYEAIIQNTSDIIYTVDSNATITFISDNIKRYGYEPSELVGANIATLIHEKDRDRVMADFQAELKFDESFPTDFRLVDKTGSEFHVEERGKKSYTPSGSVQKGGVIRDITERKKIEIALKQAKEKAEESDKLKSSFLANISHEVRTPLNAIMGFSNLMISPDTEDDKKQEYSVIVNQSVDQLLTIITDIIDISIIESNQITVVNESFLLNDLFDDVKNVFTPVADRKGISFFTNIYLDEEDCEVNTDKDKLLQILKKLGHNAMKFTNSGFIEVGVKRYEEAPQFLHFWVKDTGTGIEESKQDLIFERFRKADDKAANVSEGNGLGLAITKAFVEHLGGKIWLESEVGEGAYFSFTIPFNPVFKKVVSEVTGGETVYDWSNRKILVAEDEFANYYLLQEMLYKTGIKVFYAENGLDAVNICKQEGDFDVILMDLKMPEMNGFEATQEIKEIYHRLPIIAQTAYTASNDRLKAYDAGCDYFLEKPIKSSKLLTLLSNIFDALGD